MVATISSNVSEIRTKVRRLTASPSSSQLTDDQIDEAVQTAYVQELPADVKSQFFKEVVDVYLEPNQDRYALAGEINTVSNPDVNTSGNVYESIREPVYVEGRRAKFYKDRGQFYADWPRTATLDTSLTGGATTGNITAIDISGAPTVEITTASTTGLQNGDVVTFANVGGTTELNGNSYAISNLTATTFEVTQAAPSAFTSGGTWSYAIQRFSTTLSAPTLQQEIVIGTKVGGQSLRLKDGGDGVIYNANQADTVGEVAGIDITGAPTLIVTTKEPHGLTDGTSVTFANVSGTTELNNNSYVIANASATTFEITQAAPTAYTGGGTFTATNVFYGSIDYVTGALSLTFPIAPDADEAINIWYYWYTAGRPYAVLYWKNELIVRPVPDKVYRVEVEAYKYPDQFTDDENTPILKQWWQWLALAASIIILSERQDMEGVTNLAPILERQERLIRNRKANEEIGQRNATIYEGSQGVPGIPFANRYW